MSQVVIDTRNHVSNRGYSIVNHRLYVRRVNLERIYFHMNLTFLVSIL